MRDLKSDKLLRPTQHVEKILVTAILDGTYSCGTALPNERSLAEQLGVTRPTLRETLQRLAAEGWISIHHGKPTVVNDYWQEGGLRLLSTVSKHSDYLPSGFIAHLLEVRLTMLPAVAGRAARFQPDMLLYYLAGARKLQMLMARNSQNPVFSLILNDFAQIFANMAMHYFNLSRARRASRAFYHELARAIEKHTNTVEDVVKKAMEESISIWKEVKAG